MNKEEIDKWLYNEYGTSYTRLEELHDFLCEQNMKLQNKIEHLQQELNQKDKIIEEIKEYVKLEGVSYLDFAGNRCFCNKNQARYILEKIEELEKGSEE